MIRFFWSELLVLDIPYLDSLHDFLTAVLNRNNSYRKLFGIFSETYLNKFFFFLHMTTGLRVDISGFMSRESGTGKSDLCYSFYYYYY